MNGKNPFTITFGKQPDRFIFRYEDTDRIVSTFDCDSPVSQAFLIEGIRGSGKTVLMTSVARQLSETREWIVINLNPTMDLLSNFAIRLSDACDAKTDVLKRGFNVSAAGFGIGVDADEKATDSVGLIEKSFQKVVKKKKKVLITIDEVINDKNMRIFASQFQIFIRQDYPIYLIMTGLHENIFGIQNDPSLTFLLRTPKVTTGPLSLLQIKRQYAEIFYIDEEEAGILANMTKGYAFAFQALSVCCWEESVRDMRIVLKKYEELLDDFVFRKIWSSLTAKEKEIVYAIPDEEEKVGEICRKISMSSGTFSKYKESLMEKGVLEASRYGYVSIALPRFYQVVREYKRMVRP